MGVVSGGSDPWTWLLVPALNTLQCVTWGPVPDPSLPVSSSVKWVCEGLTRIIDVEAPLAQDGTRGTKWLYVTVHTKKGRAGAGGGGFE